MREAAAVHADRLRGSVGDYQVESDRYRGQLTEDLIEKVRIVDVDNHSDPGFACEREVRPGSPGIGKSTASPARSPCHPFREVGR
jgi:hypothetical protein